MGRLRPGRSVPGVRRGSARCGPVHAVTLADGHAAWLVVGYEEAQAAAQRPPPVEGHAGRVLERRRRARGGPARPGSRGTCSWSIRPTTRGCAGCVASAFSLRRIEALEPRVQRDRRLDCSTDSPPPAPTPPSTSCPTSRFRSRSRSSASCSACPSPIERRSATALMALLVTDRHARAVRAREGRVRRGRGACSARSSSEGSSVPGDDLVTALIRPRDGDERLDQQELLSTILQLIVAGHDTTTSLIGNGVVALLRHPDQLAACAPIRPARGRGRGAPALRRAGAALDVPLRGRDRRARRRHDPGGRAGDHLASRPRIATTSGSPTPSGSTSTGGENRHLAFGHGIHFCLGAPLARMEGTARARHAAAALPRPAPRGRRDGAALGPRRRAGPPRR